MGGLYTTKNISLCYGGRKPSIKLLKDLVSGVSSLPDSQRTSSYVHHDGRSNCGLRRGHRSSSGAPSLHTVISQRTNLLAPLLCRRISSCGFEERIHSNVRTTLVHLSLPSCGGDRYRYASHRRGSPFLTGPRQGSSSLVTEGHFLSRSFLLFAHCQTEPEACGSGSTARSH